MTALWSHITNQKSLLSLCHAHQLSAVVFAALEVGLFEALNNREGSSVEELAQSLKLPVHNVYRLVRLLLGMGLLERVDGGIKNAALASSMLVSSSPDNCVSVLLYQARNVYPAYGKLPEALRMARTEHQPADYALYDQLDTDAYKVYLGGANFYSSGVGTELAQSIDFAGVKHVVDLGSGGGKVAQELMEAVPHISMTLIDCPQAHAYMTARPEMQRLSERFTCIEGNFLQPLPLKEESADVVILSSVLGDWNKSDRSKIIRNARSVLKPGGVLLITETLLDDDGLGPLRAGVISVYVLLLTKGGDNYPASFWREELSESGFEVGRVYRNADKGMRDIIVATKEVE